MELLQSQSRLCFISGELLKSKPEQWLKEFQATMGDVTRKLGHPVTVVFHLPDGLPAGIQLPEGVEFRPYEHLPAGHLVMSCDPDDFLGEQEEPEPIQLPLPS